MNYDDHLNEVNIKDRIFKITPKIVYEIFGIPIDKIPVLKNYKPRLGDNYYVAYKLYGEAYTRGI